MKEKERFLEAVSAVNDGETLTNVKFFLGSDRNITQEDLFRESANAMRQVALGAVKAVACIDSDIPLVSITKFLS